MRKKVIVIGGGTAGSIICKNLSSKFDVCLFEKSENEHIPLLNQIPLLIGLLYKRANKFIRKIELELNIGRKVPFFISNTLGGASVMNGCVHVAGSKGNWDRLLRRFGLTIEDLDASYKRLFSKIGEKNKITIEKAKRSNLDTVFFAALKEKGIAIGDVEWIDSCESGSVYNTINRIFRSSIRNLKPYKNVLVKINHEVSNLVVDDSFNVIGVFANGKYFFADYVVLCGGVIGTNVLLQNQAIRLSDMSFVELPIKSGVGIQDHTNLRVNVLASKGINSLNQIGSSAIRKIWLVLGHLFGLKTLMMGTGASSAAHLDIDADGVVDTRIQLLNFSETGRIGSDGKLFSTSEPGFSISITVINPRSFGEIKINSRGLIIKPNYLSNDYDIEHLEKTLSFVVDMLESAPFKSIVKSIDQSEIIKFKPRDYVLANCFSGYHLVGGCSHLIDDNFELAALKNLYLCDASIMSEHVSSNIHAAVVCLADMFSIKFINKLSLKN
jgi:choline dehydrogenase-like flavoprotein